jgi:hypothetical protein
MDIGSLPKIAEGFAACVFSDICYRKVSQLLGHDGIISFCFFSSDMFFFLCRTVHTHRRFKITLPNNEKKKKKHL